MCVCVYEAGAKDEMKDWGREEEEKEKRTEDHRSS
jgi:hypothetical protein